VFGGDYEVGLVVVVVDGFVWFGDGF